MLKKFVAAFMSAVMLLGCMGVNASANNNVNKPYDIATSAYDDSTSDSAVDVGNDDNVDPNAGMDAIVLFDISSSMDWFERGDFAKEYAKEYAQYVLSDKDSRISLVLYGDYATQVLDFSRNYDEYERIINDVSFTDLTYMDTAFELAEVIAEASNKDNVEICFITDGLPEFGKTAMPNKFAKYTGSISYEFIECGEYLYNYVKNNIHPKYRVRTQGVYFGMDDDTKEFAVDFLSSLANPDTLFNADFEEPDDITFESDSETTTYEYFNTGNGSKKAMGITTASKTPVEPEDVYVYGALKGLPLVDTYEIDNKDKAVAAVQDIITKIDANSKLDANDPEVGLEVANFAEAAISLSAQADLASNGVITNETINKLAEKANDTKAEIDKVLADNNVELPRELLDGVTLNSNEGTIQIDNAIKDLPVDNVYVNVGETGLGLTINKEFIEDNDSDEPLVVSFTADEVADTASDASVSDVDNNDGKEVAAANAVKGKFTINKSVNTPMILTLSLIADKSPTYQGVKGPDGLAVSLPNSSKRNISFRATKSGSYTTTNVSTLNFKDINALSREQQDTLRRLYAHGLIEGKSATEFAPSTTLTRAEFTTLLIKAIGKYDPEFKGNSGFVDMRDHWSAPVIARAKNLGIIAGYDSDNTFRPNNKLNNEQLYHLLGLTYAKGNKRAAQAGNRANAIVGQFRDNEKLSQWAKKNVAIAVESNIYTGNQAGTFSPRNEVTRLNAAFAMGKLFEISPFDGNWK